MTNHQNKCFISLIIKALEINKKFKLYTSEKEYAKAENKNAELNKSLDTKLNKSFDVLKAQRNEKNASFFNKILVEDSSENFFLKSVLGFLGGIFLTYICYMFLVFSLNFTLKRATYICIGLGVILSLGLAFSVKIRCTVFLCIPQLFSKRGRQALLAYAFILALSGPAKNTLHNVEVMSESLACTQEQLKQAENELSKCVQKPNAVAKRSMEKLLDKINCAVKDFKHFILQLYKTCFDILQTVFQAQKWLYSITLLCQKKMGKPAHRCLNLLAEARENCEASIPFESWKNFCKFNPYSQGVICSVDAETICRRSDLPDFLPVLKLQQQLKAFKHRAMNILYVSIETHQTYFQTNRSFTYHEEYQGMATEIRQKTDQFLQYFDFMSVIFGIFILVLFAKVIIYRHKFLTQDHFDNRYITNDFVDIDNTRAAFQMETLLPLTCREKMQYIKVWSVRLVPSERVQLFSSFVFLIFATFKIIIHMLTDSSLYWILSTVRREERLLYISTIREEESITVRVVGKGLVAALIQNVTRAVRRESSLVRLDPTPCLPDPVPPDWNRYCQIIALVIICWLLALCEPYGLRLRHAVMVTYHPDRARERAIWLYNRIISNRISFIKVSRRQIRRKYKDVALEKTFRYKFMRKASSLKCLLCESTIYSFDNYVKCSSVKCLGLYCASCFQDLKFCCICSDPAKYGDLSDLSEEKDSSDEDIQSETVMCKSQKGKGPISGGKKEGISLQIKKPNFKLKNCVIEDTERNDSNRLIRPALLLHVFQLWRNKVSCLSNLEKFSNPKPVYFDYGSNKLIERSSTEVNCQILDENGVKSRKVEFESVEYEDTESKQTEKEPICCDYGSNKLMEESSTEVNCQILDDNCIKPKKVKFKSVEHENTESQQIEKETPSIKSSLIEISDVYDECQKSENLQKPKTSSKIDVCDVCDESQRSENLKKPKTSRSLVRKVCLFKNISTLNFNFPIHKFRMNFDNSENSSERSKPICDFKKGKRGIGVCFQNFVSQKPKSLRHKDSVEILKLKKKCYEEISSQNSSQEEEFVLSNRTEKVDASYYRENPDTEVIIGLLEMNGKFGKPENSGSQVFPFIDPINVHEFDASENSEDESISFKTASAHSHHERSLDKEQKKSLLFGKPNFLAPKYVRLCREGTDSSDSTRENVRICLGEETPSSSIDSDSQFYSQSYHPPGSYLSFKESNRSIKRVSAKLNFTPKTHKCGAFGSTKTDSSNQNSFSVKTSRRIRKKRKKCKQIEKESDTIMKLLSSQASQSKRNEFFKAKVYQFYKKNMRERKSSVEDGSSDIDDVEYTPNTAIFLSDEEFQKLSEQINSREAKEIKTDSDLISESPSCRK